MQKILNNLKYAKEGITYRYKHLVLETGDSNDARYCYSVWMRHLIIYYEMKQNIPQMVVEFGPGDTIGTGLIALLCGAREYYALDFEQYHGMKKIDIVFNQLLKMIKQKSAIPDDTEFPNCIPKLKTYEFPNHILTDEFLQECLNENRVNEIRRSIQKVKRGEDSSLIHYLAPWWKRSIKDIKCDLVFSQAVFEPIDDYQYAHKVIGDIAERGAVISHVIDFNCHGCADRWNGYWAYGKVMWKLVYGSRPYFLNRVPLSKHIKEMQASGVTIRRIIRTRGKDGISYHQLCGELRGISKRDFVTKNAYVLGIKC